MFFWPPFLDACYLFRLCVSISSVHRYVCVLIPLLSRMLACCFPLLLLDAIVGLTGGRWRRHGQQQQRGRGQKKACPSEERGHVLVDLGQRPGNGQLSRGDQECVFCRCLSIYLCCMGAKDHCTHWVAFKSRFAERRPFVENSRKGWVMRRGENMRSLCALVWNQRPASHVGLREQATKERAGGKPIVGNAKLVWVCE